MTTMNRVSLGKIGADWYHSIGDCIEWADGTIDAVYTNAATFEAEFRPATKKQIEMFRRHKAWVKAGCPDITIPLSELLGR